MAAIPSVRAFLEKAYGLTGEVSKLAGENENYLVKEPDGTRYVLKLADESATPDLLEMEDRVVEVLARSIPDRGLPLACPTLDGGTQARVDLSGGETIRGRLLTFVQGKAWRESVPAGPERLADLGSLIARMHLALSEFSHPQAHRTHAWDLARAQQHRTAVLILNDPEQRRILEQIFLGYAALVVPVMDALPRTIIHGDLNDDNVLIQGGRISGILDFGDCLTNPMACDLAIALAYHTLDEPDPLSAAADIIGAYHRVRPLTLDEITVLFPLMCTRLAVSVLISARRRKIDPARDSWFVSEKRAWHNLKLFSRIEPARAAILLASQTNLTPYNDRGQPPENLMIERRRFIAPSLRLSYAAPLKILEGKGQFLYDYHGRPFLDLYNNVCHVGHCHPRVVEAGQRQMARLNTNTRYLYDGLTNYAERLCATLPDELDTCFFVNSGSEANELALRIARTCTGRRGILVVDHAYHGHTQALTEISPYKFMGKGGTGRPEPWVHVVPLADPYRGEFKGLGKDTGKAYGDAVGRIIDSLPEPPAGFITESLLSCGGQVIPPRGYFETAFAHVRSAGGLCIADEVQTGFGRVGDRFWAFELQNVVPDIVVLGKPMGNGHPMAAVITRKDLARRFANGMEFFATFGGNPVSCAVGMAVLDVLADEGLQENARQIGNYMQDGLVNLKAKHEIIGDVRGVGLFIGIELVESRETLAPAAQRASDTVDRLRRRCILTGTDGPFGNVIKIKPPMVVNREDADMFIRVLDDILTHSSGKDQING